MMTRAIFVDTGALFALEYARDQYHEQSVRIFARIRKQSRALVTSTLVFNETVTLLQRRCSHETARQFGHRVLNSRHVEMVSVDEQLLARAWDEFSRSGSKSLTLTDCVSRAIIRARKIQRVFAFDQHLAVAGTELLVCG